MKDPIEGIAKVLKNALYNKKKLWENNVIFSITLNYQVSGEKTRKLQSTYAYRNVSPPYF